MKKYFFGILVLLLVASLSLNVFLFKRDVKTEKPKDDIEFVFEDHTVFEDHVNDHWVIYISEKNPRLLHGQKMENLYRASVPTKNIGTEKKSIFWVIRHVESISRSTNEFSLDILQLFSSIHL